jgi:hypothetical protein
MDAAAAFSLTMASQLDILKVCAATRSKPLRTTDSFRCWTPLEPRTLFVSISNVFNDFFNHNLRTVTVDGDNVSETWTINHDGNGGIHISGPNSADRSDVQVLTIRTNGGADTVRYNLTGDNVAVFTLNIDTGDGGAGAGVDDTVTVNLNGNINRSLQIGVQTRNFKDHITVNADRDNHTNGVRIASGRELGLFLLGGDNEDTFDISYQGDMDGTLTIQAFGDGGGGIFNGNDTINALVIMDDGSGHLSTGQSGLGTLDMKLEGNGATDTFSALVGDHSGGNVHFNQALVTSGGILNTVILPEDKVTHTANVDVQGFQPNAPFDVLASAPAFLNRKITSPAGRGSPATLSGIITEPDAGDTFFLDVDWGDGTPKQTYTFLPGTFVSGTTVGTAQHTYTHVGHYRIRFTWRDQTGLSTDDSLTVKVLPPQAIHGHTH